MTDYKKLLDIEFMDAKYHGGEITPQLVVIHHTAVVDRKNNIGSDNGKYWLANPSPISAKPSVHFHIGVKGKVTIYRNVIGMSDQWVKRANHAGDSRYMINGLTFNGINGHSIGIEVAGDTNRYPLTDIQYKALVNVSKWINEQFPYLAYRNRWVRHADVAIPRGRKNDIGTKYFSFSKFLDDVFED